MTNSFEPNKRLLKILVGSNLYGSSDACIRELLQNAWDAIQLRKEQGDGAGGKIVVAYSVKSGWFEVSDDGIGMSEKAVTKSFLQVGADKLEALEIHAPVSQVGQFGIGVLSIFLLADRFEVTTKSYEEDDHAIRFSVNDLYEPVEFDRSSSSSPGTKIRVYPREDSQFSLGSLLDSVSNYARHVEGITVHSVDDDTRTIVADSWNTKSLQSERNVEGISSVNHGIIGFLPALRDNVGTLENRITICNAGFLVESEVRDLLPITTLSVGGEIDVKPHSLNIGMSRERFQRDEKWSMLGQELQEFIVHLVISELETGELTKRNTQDSDFVKRNILLWYHFLPPEPPFSNLYQLLDDRVYSTVPFNQMERARTTLESLVGQGLQDSKLYFRQIDRSIQQTLNIDDEGIPIRLSHEIRDSVRVGALRAKGFKVLDLKDHVVNVSQDNVVQTHKVHEHSLLRKCLPKRGIQLVDISEAPDSDMDMSNIESLPILRNALPIPGGLRFAFITDSKRRVVLDQANIRYVNLQNPHIQRLLRCIPDATSNLLKNKLLETLLNVEDFKLSDAREVLLQLLENQELETFAATDMAPLTKRFLSILIEDELRKLEL